MLLLDYWKDIPGFDRHQASYNGYIRHLGKVNQKRGYNFEWVPAQNLSLQDNGIGYLKVTITLYGIQYKEYVHILVGKTFIKNPDNLPEINHLNTDKSDNRVPNLEWCTHKQNMEHASKLGRMNRRKKSPTIVVGE